MSSSSSAGTVKVESAKKEDESQNINTVLVSSNSSETDETIRRLVRNMNNNLQQLIQTATFDTEDETTEAGDRSEEINLSVRTSQLLQDSEELLKIIGHLKRSVIVSDISTNSGEIERSRKDLTDRCERSTRTLEELEAYLEFAERDIEAHTQ